MVKPNIQAEGIREAVRRESKQPKPKEKGRQSQFEQVLKEQAQRLQQPAIVRQSVTQAATQQAARQVRRHEDRGRDSKGRDKGEEKEGRKGAEGDRKTDAKVAEQKVVAKHALKDEGGGGGRGGKGGGFAGQRKSTTSRAKQPSKQGPALLREQFAKKLSRTMREPSRAFTERMLNQIVKFVRIAINNEEEKEMRLELHERFFRGLKFKVTRKGEGRVAVHFNTANSEVRELFEKNSDRIREALERKGIEVAEIAIS